MASKTPPLSKWVARWPKTRTSSRERHSRRSHASPPCVVWFPSARGAGEDLLTVALLIRLQRAGYDPFAPVLATPDPLQIWRLAFAALLGRL